MPTATQLDPTIAHRVMLAACQILGFDPNGSQLIRMGENALFRLPRSAVVVRIGRSFQELNLELSVANWLKTSGVPCSDPAVEKVIDIDGHPVSAWKLIESDIEKPTASELGAILRLIHDLPEPVTFNLPEFQPMPKVNKRLRDLETYFDQSIVDFLRSKKNSIEKEFKEVASELGSGPIHGDAHIGNLMRGADKRIRIIDYGDFCIGPREWDLCTPAVGFKVGTLSEESYKEFASAYGFDVLKWQGFETFQSARELNMTVWLMQLTGQSKEIDEEIEKRIRDLHGNGIRRWKPF